MSVADLSVPAAELVIVGHYDKGPGYATRRASGSASWLLMFTQDGAGLVEQGGTVLTAGPGDLVVLAARTAHHYRTAGARWRFWWVHFQPRPAWAAWLRPFGPAPGCHLVPGCPPLEPAFRRAHAYARWNGRGSPPAPADPVRPAVATAGRAGELVLGAVEEVLLLATAPRQTPGAGMDERVERVLELISAEPAAPHTVASLAGAVALSPSRLAHLFAERTGRTPMRAVRAARLAHAARLLEVTDLDVGQVGAASGFVSAFHFSRTFAKEYGLPPREYRRRLG
ncbi:helix-turn-helix domain-containing protein [Nonomuraea typhae]|uniref:helix-turn-helix domain-containing protein n=1 Tax=Nonomuraea typhae TaxID=2603600 RepID=UPI001CA54BCF|nr:helix-turn-helix domain-containing protein [Nonomuraea typhae]